MNKRRKILAAMLAAFMLLVSMVSTAQIDIKGDGGETSDLSGTWGTMQITDNETGDYVPLGEGLWLLAGAAGLYLLVKSRKTRKATAVAAAALALTLGTAQCKKTEESVIPAGETISISFMAGNGAKADIDVTTGRITWEKDDKVYVVCNNANYAPSKGNKAVLLGGNLKAQTENSQQSEISGEVTVPEGYNLPTEPSFTFYYVGKGVKFTPTEASTNLTFDISSQNGIDAGHYMVGRTEAVEMKVKEGTENSYMPTQDGAKHFDPLTSVLRLDTKAFGAGQMTMGGGNNLMTINLAGDATPSYTAGSITFTSGDDIQISVIPTTTDNANVNVTLSFSGNGKDGSITVKNGIKAGRIYSKVINNAGYPIPVEAIESGILPGLFSVSADKQVRFSKGNLQYLADDGSGTYPGKASATADDGKSVGGTWRFAEHQYDVIGNDNMSAAPDYTKWIDLFGWGTSGYKYDNVVYYQPWSITSNDYKSQYGSSDKDLIGKMDWGYNAISNGGKVENSGWRTLNSTEWEFLFNRTTTDGKKLYSRGKVAGVNGVIILPDGKDPSILLNGHYGSSTSYTSNQFDVEAWKDMEAEGAVFLPAAGGRYEGTGFSSTNYYWSSTHYSTYGGNNIRFDDHDLFNITNCQPRNYGMSVRLVKDAPTTR